MRSRFGIKTMAVVGALALFVANAHGDEPKKTRAARSPTKE